MPRYLQCLYLMLVYAILAASSAPLDEQPPPASTITVLAHSDAETGPRTVVPRSVDSSAAPADAPSARSLGDGNQLHVASGAYPVYYSVARSNGRFSKRIRAFSSPNQLPGVAHPATGRLMIDVLKEE